MRRFFLTMMLLFLITPFTMRAQTLTPVADVQANVNNNTVDLVWSWDKIVPEMVSVDFETGDFSQADFFNDPTSPWAITTDAYEGTYAIKSTCEGVSNGVSAIEITVDVPFDATMSFYHKIDCEYYFDNGYFFIDGVERAKITSNVDWEYKEFNVKKGIHTYRWTYRKDSDDYGSSTDAYFVDNIVLYKKLEPFTGGWIHYDDGNNVQALGSETGFLDWGICFPNTEEYAGYNLTKVALYDENAATVYAKIYYGGTDAPGTIVTSEAFTLTGAKTIKEFALQTPIPIEGTEPLWITFHSTDPTYVGTLCNYVGDKNSDWCSFDNGATWGHLTELQDGIFQYSWMVRGYLENSRGEKAVLNNNAKTADNFKVYRTNILDNQTELLANVSDTTYTDNTWSTLQYGAYKYGVAAVYDNGESEIVWSDNVDKDMFVTLELNVATNNANTPAGAKVKFNNLLEPEYSYNIKLDESGSYTWNKFRKGTYSYTISLDGFEALASDNFSVEGAQELSLTLNEIKAAVENLYVSPTGYAMWENASYDNGGGRFFFDFENGLMDGWRTIDADGDGYTWRLTTDIMGPGYGHNGSRYCVISQSYCVDTIGALTPDNYLITTDKYLITDESQLTYFVCAQDAEGPAEHYAVLVSTATEPTENDFVTVWEETMTRGSKATRNSRAQGAWYKRIIDLKDFAGQEVHIAFRHFNTTGQFYLDIDDIALVNAAKSLRDAVSYTVKLNGETVANEITTNYYQFEDVTVGETYTASVAANYATGTSEFVDYAWTCVSADEYAGVTSLKGRCVAGKAFVEWTLEGDETSGDAENNFFFDFNDCTLNGWRNIDADGDGHIWYNSSEKFMYDEVFGGYGYKDKGYCALSHSFYSGQFNYTLTPDNYLVTEKKYAITEGTQLSFVACAQDPSYHKEHYGVAISLVDNATPEDFITIWEETFTSDDTNYEEPQTEWQSKTIDLSQYAGEEIYIAFRHFNCTDQYMILIDNATLTSGEKSSREEKQVLGAIVYRDGELLTEKPVTKRSFYSEFPGDGEYEYCIQVVYEDYGMSAPQCVTIDAPINCVAPKDLYGEVAVKDGVSGVSLVWPYKLPPTSEWLYYDNNVPYSGVGMNGNPFYWAIMLPVEKLANYSGTSITKVMTYDIEACNATILISYGSASQPFSPVHTENITFTGSKDWKEVTLSQAVPVTGEDNIWIMMYQVGAQHPATICIDDTGDVNGRWFSSDGMEWYDLNSMGQGFNYAWVLRAFVTNETDRTSELKEIEFQGETAEMNPENISILDEPIVATSNRNSALDHYNVYRGYDLNDMTKIAETKDGAYFDAITSDGVYYYQVKAVYVDGEETCESEAANSFNNPGQNYVMFEILGVGENDAEAIMIYPNPTKGDLTIKAEAMSRITIVNALGQVVYDNNVNSDNEVINMSQYEAGLYMVRITTETDVIVKRVLKQ